MMNIIMTIINWIAGFFTHEVESVQKPQNVMEVLDNIQIMPTECLYYISTFLTGKDIYSLSVVSGCSVNDIMYKRDIKFGVKNSLKYINDRSFRIDISKVRSVCVYFIPKGYKIAFSLGLYIGCIYIFGLKIIFFSLY